MHSLRDPEAGGTHVDLIRSTQPQVQHSAAMHSELLNVSLLPSPPIGKAADKVCWDGSGQDHAASISPPPPPHQRGVSENSDTMQLRCSPGSCTP